MAVRPMQLHPITADSLKFHQVECLGAELDMGANDATEGVGFPLAGGARTGAAQQRQFEVKFGTIRER